MITQQQFDGVLEALKAIPSEPLERLRDLPSTLPFDFLVQMRERLKAELTPLEADMRVSLLLHLRKATVT